MGQVSFACQGIAQFLAAESPLARRDPETADPRCCCVSGLSVIWNEILAWTEKSSRRGKPPRKLNSTIPSLVMHREALVEPRQEILRTAARLFQERGYDATSMNDVAAALKLSKGGLYHHFQSKDEILFHIMSHAMDITEERVINPARRIESPEERLRTLIRLHIEVVISEEDREITVMLHENHPLPPTLRRRINTRKKEYIHFVESLIAEVQKQKGTKGTVSAR